MKDYVRCSFYFRSPHKLVEAFDDFIYNQSTGRYSIIEVKNKMNTHLQLINIIVYNQNGGTMGEI